MELACPAFKGCPAHAHRGLPEAVSGIDHVTVLHIDHIGLEGHGWLCKLPGTLESTCATWNPQVPALGVARHLVKVLGDENDEILSKQTVAPGLCSEGP